ncbi:MAG: hypothetical protein CBC09_05000 [Cellvibrionales bacterium TMED49]|nr:hypothetical protein [Porticoccaceae bacterium]OUU38637.1 MAG: hypothetical protein CBC09_05000 [Cellvibrionales bacterium TMED49]|tara:strand:- start:130 stop:549 length:420 start_codon:yes stop_codon:yes gene_type:complete
MLYRILLVTLVTMSLGHAESFRQYGKLKIFYSAFPSAFITADIAQKNNIVRGINRGIVNISAMRHLSNGLPATVTGRVSNIMQQNQTLSFKTIREGTSIYYIAPFKFENEDYLTFRVKLEMGTSEQYDIKFQKLMYIDK